MNAMGCPSCSQPMTRRAFTRKPFGDLDIDMCFACRAIWFDRYESAQLTAGAILSLFRQIQEHHDEAALPLSPRMHCPACRAVLQLTRDIERSNHISYFRCTEGHGRLTTFFEFLREKNFVRSLTPPEMAQLRASVAQVRCSSCGAPVSLEQDAQCSHCGAPVSILDADALNRTIVELGEAEGNRRQVDPARVADVLLAVRRAESSSRNDRMQPLGGAVVDLLFDGLHEILDH